MQTGLRWMIAGDSSMELLGLFADQQITKEFVTMFRREFTPPNFNR